MNKVITVTSPLLPPLEEFIPYLEDIWRRKWLTNNGFYHQELEKALCEYLKVPYISLFTNGTLPLICALQAMRITGEVITTPYSFVATTHALWWNGIKPVFVDVDPLTGNMDPEKIEAAITPKTTAVMPVHVYGQPCNIERIQEIADIYGLKVIYDAAHAFGVEKDGVSIIKEVRQNDYVKPLILLTARSEQEDIIKGLEAGADDYLTKPFQSAVLIARIEAHLRRHHKHFLDEIKFEDVMMNTKNREVTIDAVSYTHLTLPTILRV
mgnify:CR=1 FL=1